VGHGKFREGMCLLVMNYNQPHCRASAKSGSAWIDRLTLRSSEWHFARRGWLRDDTGMTSQKECNSPCPSDIWTLVRETSWEIHLFAGQSIENKLLNLTPWSESACLNPLHHRLMRLWKARSDVTRHSRNQRRPVRFTNSAREGAAPWSLIASVFCVRDRLKEGVSKDPLG
jgi:hypothetical protein